MQCLKGIRPDVWIGKMERITGLMWANGIIIICIMVNMDVGRMSLFQC